MLERLPGQTLADLIAVGPMPPAHVRAMLEDVLAGLQAAHSAGILHRDIKPGNILVSAPGDSMKVADFGIAKTGGGAATTTGQIVGTMSYLSPERITGAPATVADDLYAVGLMAYEALLGRRLFAQDNPAALARAVMDDPPPPLDAIRSDVDPFLAAVIDRSITRNSLQRFSTAAQMRAALAGDQRALYDITAPVAAPPRPATKVLPGLPIPATPYFIQPSRPRPGRRRMYVSAAAVLIALAVSVVALAMDPSSAPPPQPAGTSEPVVSPTSVAPPPSPVVQPPVPNTDGGPAGRGHGKGDKKRG
ncbi:serine/threonine-protein kinase [Mycolicibacterium sphagni]|uniref:serine/threonine-protein kinase n=1 Tax=Mycolicibacterium sphagni TaxID=1786 RepID=UPI0031F5A8EA